MADIVPSQTLEQKMTEATKAGESTWTDDQKTCIRALADWAGGKHHLPDVKPFGDGVCINWYGAIHTFDFDQLTRLVLIAHRDKVRMGVTNSGPGMIKITAFCRTGPDHLHPSLQDLIAEASELQEGKAKP